ncbi:MAG: T9SS type A sorting domain-containing protein [Bacteroidota bacterium]
MGLGGSGLDLGRRIVVDGSGNSYTAGAFEQSMDIDNGPSVVTVTSVGARDAFLTKYAPGGFFLWGFGFGGSGRDIANDVVIAPNGDLIVSGEFDGTADFDPSPNAAIRTSSGLDGFIARYTSDGQFVSVFHFEGAGRQAITQSAVLPDGSIVGLATFVEELEYQGSPIVASSGPGPNRTAVIKLQSNGSFVRLEELTSGSQTARSVKAKGGRVAVSAFGFGNVNYDGNTTPRGDGAVVLMLDEALDFIWGRAFEPGAGTQVSELAFSDSGDLLGTGHYAQTGLGFQAFVISYSSSGVLQWERSFGGTGNDLAFGIDINQNRVYGAGQFTNTVDFDPGSGVAQETSNGSFDLFVNVLNLNGDFLEVLARGASGEDVAFDIDARLGASEGVYITGSFEGVFAINRVASNGGRDIYIARVPPIALPVEFSDVQIRVVETSLNIAWTTLSELNNAGFEIELSREAGAFENVGYVSGHGTTTEAQHYVFQTSDLDPGRYQARLRQVDFDGTAAYSEIVEAEILGTQPWAIDALYPSPTSSTINVRLSTAIGGAYTLRLIDALGRKLTFNEDAEMQAGGVAEHVIELDRLPPGLYVLELSSGSHRVTESLTVMR